MIGLIEAKYQQMKYDFRNYTNHVRGELQGANEDHLSMHDNKIANHEERLV